MRFWAETPPLAQTGSIASGWSATVITQSPRRRCGSKHLLACGAAAPSLAQAVAAPETQNAIPRRSSFWCGFHFRAFFLRFDSQRFRVLFLHRLWQPLPRRSLTGVTVRWIAVTITLHRAGHRECLVGRCCASLPRTSWDGDLQLRSVALECAGARVCREGGHSFQDSRRLEVAVGAFWSSAWPWRTRWCQDPTASQDAQQRRRRGYLTEKNALTMGWEDAEARVRFVALAHEFGRCWSEETRTSRMGKSAHCSNAGHSVPRLAW